MAYFQDVILDGIPKATNIQIFHTNFQFFVTSVFYLLTWTTWQWLPYMSASKWIYFIMTSLFFVNNSVRLIFHNFSQKEFLFMEMCYKSPLKVNPTIYLLFNTNLRRRLFDLFCRKHNMMTSSVQNITLKPLSMKPSFANSKAWRLEHWTASVCLTQIALFQC